MRNLLNKYDLEYHIEQNKINNKKQLALCTLNTVKENILAKCQYYHP